MCMYVSFETVSFIGQELMSPRDPPVSTFPVLRLQTCATLPGINVGSGIKLRYLRLQGKHFTWTLARDFENKHRIS